ncbi:MAG: hypothetical protein JWR83_1881 [Aeromicrobium sp.]|nr:hypothetical protein [Aeromicrobium sp.]
MNRIEALSPAFVEHIPTTLEPGTIYISLEYGTAQHLCCCGCGTEVVTPIHPSYWTLIYDGDNVSLHPSVGNWSLPCRSHYVVREGRVRWAKAWTTKQVDAGRVRDRLDVDAYFRRSASGLVRADEQSSRPQACSSATPNTPRKRWRQFFQRGHQWGMGVPAEGRGSASVWIYRSSSRGRNAVFSRYTPVMSSPQTSMVLQGL